MPPGWSRSGASRRPISSRGLSGSTGHRQGEPSGNERALRQTAPEPSRPPAADPRGCPAPLPDDAPGGCEGGPQWRVGASPLTPATYSVPPLAPFSAGCIDMVPLAEALRSDRGADTVRDVDAYLESAAAERRASAWPTPWICPMSGGAAVTSTLPEGRGSATTLRRTAHGRTSAWCLGQSQHRAPESPN